jgi:phage-related protein
MPKTLPAGMKEDLILPNSGGAWMWLCEIVVPTKTTQYIARNTEDVTYAGQVYTKGNIDINGQVFNSDGSLPRVVIKVAHDLNRTIEQIVDETQGALGATVTLIKVGEKFLSAAVPALEIDYSSIAAESDAESVTFTLGIPNPMTQKIPLRTYSSTQCPYATVSLFKGVECQYVGGDTTCTGTYSDCKGKGNQVHWGGEKGLTPKGMRVA